MIVASGRLLVEWLTDAVNGVNVHLRNVPRDVGEAPPPPVLHYNQFDDPWVARALTHRDAFRDPGTGEPTPGLIVRHIPPQGGVLAGVLPQFVQTDPTIVPWTVQYGTRKIEGKAASPESTAVQLRDAYQTLRTVQRIIALKFDGPNRYFERNQCVITLPPQGVVLDIELVPTDDDELIASVVIPFNVLDRWALGLVSP